MQCLVHHIAAVVLQHMQIKSVFEGLNCLGHNNGLRKIIPRPHDPVREGILSHIQSSTWHMKFEGMTPEIGCEEVFLL